LGEDFLAEGGPLEAERTGPHEYMMKVGIPAGNDGMVARECHNTTCSPGYFKIMLGTGVTEAQEKAYCPYCRLADEPSAFFTAEQIEYAKGLVFREAVKGVNNMMGSALGIGPSGVKHLGGGLVSLEMRYKPAHLPDVRPPIEEELRRDVTCPECGLKHAVFGLANWCPDCGSDIFPNHIDGEIAVVKRMLGDTTRRYEQLGARVAARDVENALEDTVSIFEGSLKAMTRRFLKNSRIPDEEIEEAFRKRVGNRYQNIQLAAEVCRHEFGIELFEGFEQGEVETLRLTFEKRHPITHNLGIVDRKYMEKARSGELEGRDIPVTSNEVESTISVLALVLRRLHARLFVTMQNGSEVSNQ